MSQSVSVQFVTFVVPWLIQVKLLQFVDDNSCDTYFIFKLNLNVSKMMEYFFMSHVGSRCFVLSFGEFFLQEFFGFASTLNRKCV